MTNSQRTAMFVAIREVKGWRLNDNAIPGADPWIKPEWMRKKADEH